MILNSNFEMINSNLVLFFFIFINLFFLINFSKIKIFHFNIDKPDKKRKFHSQPTPLAGGILIFLNLIIYWIIHNFLNLKIENEIFFNNENSFNYFIIISSIIFLLGFIDDKINLKANFKFLILTFAVLILLVLDDNLIIKDIKFSFDERTFNLDTFAIFFSVFCFLVFINAFNMFDGINLQSSLYSILIFFCIIFFYSNSLLIKILIISLICFSYLNFKNKTFLGDSGSLLISFIIGYLFIKLYNFHYIDYADEIILYMIVPGLDLIRLFVLRIANKRNPLSSDRNHLHHILISKFSFKKSLTIIFLLIFLPIFFNYFDFNKLISILITILSYSIILYVSKKN